MKATTRVRKVAAEDVAEIIIPMVQEMRAAGMSESAIATAISAAMQPGLAMMPHDMATEIKSLVMEMAGLAAQQPERLQAYSRL